MFLTAFGQHPEMRKWMAGLLALLVIVGCGDDEPAAPSAETGSTEASIEKALETF